MKIDEKYKDKFFDRLYMLAKMEAQEYMGEPHTEQEIEKLIGEYIEDVAERLWYMTMMVEE